MRKSRAGRLAQLGTAAGTEAAKEALARSTRSQARARALQEARNAQMVERLVIVLGTMRGAAMKLGQLFSVLDGGLLGDQREMLQEKLAQLQSNAPVVPWPEMSRHVEYELGPISRHFREFDTTPVAAASIGQVYRATLHDGRAVAVKVQYPGIEDAVRADLKNFGLFLTAYSRFVHKSLDGRTLAAEISGRILEELDYLSEAANTAAMAEGYRDHPFIRIPRVVEPLCTKRVLVTDWLDGRPFAAAYTAGSSVRNQVSEILFRFYSGTPYRLHMFSGDPHPGNVVLLPDGSVGFLDFGLVKKVDPATATAELALLRAATEQDAAGVAAVLREQGFVDGAATQPEDLLAVVTMAGCWYLRDEIVEITPGLCNTIAAAFTRSATREGMVTRQQNLPPDHAFRVRVESQLVGTLSQLRPQLNLHRVAREWIYGDEPVSALGLAHRDWLIARRSANPASA